jgi:L-aminopeptidase/D-esterase-like protein
MGVGATDVNFTKTEMAKIGMMANCGASCVVRPYHIAAVLSGLASGKINLADF